MNIKLVDDKPEVLHELRRRINSYKKLHPNLTSQQIAKRFGMANSTFNRIENMELRKPTFDQIVKVLKGVGADDDLCELIKTNYPNIYETFEKTFIEKKKHERLYEEDSLDFMGDESAGRIVRLAASTTGVTREFVLKRFGEFGLETLDKLILKGILEKRGDAYFCVGKYSFDFEKIKKIVIQAIKDSYDAEGATSGEALNFINYSSYSVDAKTALPQVISELEKAKSKIIEIFKENQGEEVVWFSMAADTILGNSYLEQIKSESGKMQ